MAKLVSPLYSKASLWRSIRDKCLDCTLDCVSEISGCTVKSCPLFPYRMGSASQRIARGRVKETDET